VVAAVMLVAGAVAISAPERAAVVNAGATTTTAAPVASIISIRQFPVQGACWFMDTFGAPRSGGRTHEGVDIIAKAGLYLYAVDAGTLTKQYINAPGSLAGNGWRLTRADGTYFFYAHLSMFAPGLKVGSTVVAGQILGNVGMTGNAGTPHLHFEVHPGGGAAINPTATVKAVDGCKITTVPPQPGAPTVTAVPPVTTAPTSAPTTTIAAPVATTIPGTTTPGTTTPGTTTPGTTAAPVITAPAGPAELWSFIAPIRAFDSAGSKLVPGTTKRVKVAGLTGVPANTPGVMIRLAVRNASMAGFLSVFACDVAPPAVATLNYSPDRLSATMTMVKVVGGEICIAAKSAIDLRIDVVGTLSSQGVGVKPIVATRGLDTRTKGLLLANTTKAASLSALGVPSGTQAVTLTIMVLSPVAAGSIGIGPCGGTPWILPYTTAAAQVFSGIIRSNNAGICVTTTSTTHVVLDATAAWTGTAKLLPTTPTRLFDSRVSGVVTRSGTSVKLPLPAGVTRAQLTVTVIGNPSGSALFVWNCAEKKPTASVAHTVTGRVSSTTITMNVTAGSLCLASIANVHAVVELAATG